MIKSWNCDVKKKLWYDIFAISPTPTFSHHIPNRSKQIEVDVHDRVCQQVSIYRLSDLTSCWVNGPADSFRGSVVDLFSSGSQRRRSLSLPVLTLIFPALLPCLVRDSLCTALQTKILWINWSLNAIDTMETGFRGTWLPWRNVRSRLYDGAWERWRIVCLAALSLEDIDIYLFGTMITGILLIGLGSALGYRRIQKTGTAVQSPTGCPYDWSCGKSGQHWDWTIIAIWILPRRSSQLYKGNWLKWDQNGQKRTESSLQKLECLLAPKTKQSYLFWLPYSGLGKAVAGIKSGSAIQWDTLASSPTLQTLQTLPPPPRPFASVRFDPLAWSSGSDQRRISGCGIRRLLAGPDSLPPVAMSCMCFCVAEVVFPVLTLYSPRSIVWGLFFFSSLSSCKCCIFLQFYLHFTTDYTCMIVYVTNNKEPLERTIRISCRWHWPLSLFSPPDRAEELMSHIVCNLTCTNLSQTLCHWALSLHSLKREWIIK